MPPQKHNQSTPTPPPTDLAAIMDMLAKMAADTKADNLAMEPRIKQDNRVNTEQVENRINTTMEAKFSHVQEDITALNKASMEQAAKIDKLTDSLTRTEAELVKARGTIQNSQNETDTELYSKQVYVHNLAKLFPSLENTWQIRRPGPREEVANFLQIRLERDDPPPEHGADDPLNPLHVPNRYGNTNIVLIHEVTFFNPKANNTKDGEVLPAIVTFNHPSTARRFRHIYQKKHPGIVSQASLRGNPEFNKVSAQVKRVIHALKSQNYIGAWDFRPWLNRKTFTISYALQIRPDARFPNNIWLSNLQLVLGASAKDADCTNFITQLLKYPVYNQTDASINQAIKSFLAPRTRVATRSSNKNQAS